MICNKCNKEFEDGAKFCTHCGAPAEIVEEKAPTVVSVTPKKMTTKNAATEKKEESIAPKAAEEKKKEAATPTPQAAETEAAPKLASAKKTVKKAIEEKPAGAIAEVKQEVKAEAPKAEKPSEKEAEKSAEAVEQKTDKKAEKEAAKKAENEQKAIVVAEKKEKKQAVEVNEESDEPVKAEKKQKSKDRVNFFLLLLTLMCPPYFGVLITICSSAKAPRATQVYGVFTILSFIFAKIKNYILTVIATFSIIMAVLAALVSGAYLVLTELGYDLSMVTDTLSSFLNF